MIGIPRAYCFRLFLAWFVKLFIALTQMALLYRFMRLNDRANTGVFTFIVTRSVTRDFHRDATTKEFCFGYHKWALTFSRTDKMLGVFLVLKSAASPGSRCYLDFAFTLLNREHFSRNETLSERQCRFSAECPAHGSARWVLLSDLRTRRFADENGEFILELALANTLTVYEGDARLIAPAAAVAATAKVSSSTPAAATPSVPPGVAQLPRLLESAFFAFGGFEWNVTVVGTPAPISPSTHCEYSPLYKLSYMLL